MARTGEKNRKKAEKDTKIIDLSKIKDFALSPVMRVLTKELDDEKVIEFMKNFHHAFNQHLKESSPEKKALKFALDHLSKDFKIKVNKAFHLDSKEEDVNEIDLGIDGEIREPYTSFSDIGPNSFTQYLDPSQHPLYNGDYSVDVPNYKTVVIPSKDLEKFPLDGGFDTDSDVQGSGFYGIDYFNIA